MGVAVKPATYALSIADRVRLLLDKHHDAFTPDDKNLFLNFLNPLPQSSVRLNSLLEKPCVSFTAADRADWLAFRACLAVKLTGYEEVSAERAQTAATSRQVFQSA